MKKIKKFLVLLIVLFLGPVGVNAQVVITEVMYDLDGTDTGREWIEVKNSGGETVDLSTWKLFEANTNHKINASASPNLPSGGFAIIADDSEKFSADNPNFSGLLFDSTFSLSNSGETLIIRDQNLSDIDSLTYSPSIGANGDGNSLQKLDSIWIAAIPTPGAETTSTESLSTTSPETPATSTPSSSGEADITTGYSSHSSQFNISTSYEPGELSISAGRPRLGFVGAPLPFEAQTTSSKNIPLGNAVSSLWSMGDGTQKFGQFISHIYQFSGEYTVILNSQSGGAGAVSKVKVKIIEPNFLINSANTDYIEIYNSDIYELNLGNFIIETNGGRFIIPIDTIIPSHLSVKLPAAVTKLTALKDYVRVANPSGKILVTKPIENLGDYDPFIFLPEGMTREGLLENFKEALKK